MWTSQLCGMGGKGDGWGGGGVQGGMVDVLGFVGIVWTRAPEGMVDHFYQRSLLLPCSVINLCAHLVQLLTSHILRGPQSICVKASVLGYRARDIPIIASHSLPPPHFCTVVGQMMSSPTVTLRSSNN